MPDPARMIADLKALTDSIEADHRRLTSRREIDLAAASLQPRDPSDLAGALRAIRWMQAVRETDAMALDLAEKRIRLAEMRAAILHHQFSMLLDKVGGDDRREDWGLGLLDHYPTAYDQD
jgi:hypothetical protein